MTMFFVHPQIQFKHFVRAFGCLFKKPDFEVLAQELNLYFPDKQIIFTDMGRTAFRLIVEGLNLQNSQILLPAYVCDIFFPILKGYNIKPIFLDIDLKTFNIKPGELQSKLTPAIKAVLVCHTYGLPAEIQEIEQAIQSLSPGAPGPIIIEDAAHSFGAKISRVPAGTYVGNFGDVAFFSLYKQFPALRGGMLVCPKDWRVSLPKTSFNFRDFISLLNCFPFFAYLFKRFGGGIAPKMLREEKMVQPARINHASLNLFSAFREDFEKSQEQRKKLALFFQTELERLGFEVQEPENNVFCFLSALAPERLGEKRDELVKELQKQKIFCTRVWHAPIILNPEAQKEYQIDLSRFPNTLEAAKRIINFPLQSHYKERDIERIMENVRNAVKTFNKKL